MTIGSQARRRLFGAMTCTLVWFFTVAQLPAKPPTAVDFPELVTLFQPFDPYICDNSVSVDGALQFDAAASKTACSLIGAESRILSFEENSRFLCMTAQSLNSSGFVRRVILIKPSTVIVDDVAEGFPPNREFVWKLSCRKVPARENGQLVVTNDDGKLTCSTLWPVKDVPAWTVTHQTASAVQCGIKIKPAKGVVRCLHLLSLDTKEAKAGPIKADVSMGGSILQLTVTVNGNTYRLDLPRPGTDAGTVEITAADGKVATPCRPLPGGVLPHGPEGMKLIHRWDKHYQNGRWAPWNNDLPASPVLQEAIKKGIIKPCRTVVLGCGSGSNAIFLAKNGFDVTAIEIAPSALGIGMANAKKADVQVRWVLADVLALPDEKPYDLVFDRGCYHNVRYVDAAGFVASLDQLSRPKTRCFIISCNRAGPPGILEKTMRDDFSELFDFEWLRSATMHIGIDGRNKINAWSLMLSRKDEK